MIEARPEGNFLDDQYQALVSSYQFVSSRRLLLLLGVWLANVTVALYLSLGTRSLLQRTPQAIIFLVILVPLTTLSVISSRPRLIP